jgi:hypothetical protein
VHRHPSAQQWPLAVVRLPSGTGVVLVHGMMHMRGVYCFCCLLLPVAHGHGLLLDPPPRSAGQGLLSRGGSMWYTQSTTIGCAVPNITVDVHSSMHAGDLCPNDHSGAARGLPKVPTINDRSLRTWLAQGCLDEQGNPAACTAANEATDWTKFHPWRAPGNAPVYDSCGVAGASPSNNSQAAGGWGFPTGCAPWFPKYLSRPF